MVSAAQKTALSAAAAGATRQTDTDYFLAPLPLTPLKVEKLREIHCDDSSGRS